MGSYTREVLGRLPAAEEKAILANVRSDEPDVKGVVGKLTQGAADAGFVYVTDVVATDGKAQGDRAARSAAAQRRVRRRGGQGREGARGRQAFIDGLTDGAGAKALRDAGFEPPPK